MSLTFFLTNSYRLKKSELSILPTAICMKHTTPTRLIQTNVSFKIKIKIIRVVDPLQTSVPDPLVVVREWEWAGQPQCWATILGWVVTNFADYNIIILYSLILITFLSSKKKIAEVNLVLVLLSRVKPKYWALKAVTHLIYESWIAAAVSFNWVPQPIVVVRVAQMLESRNCFFVYWIYSLYMLCI